MCGEATPDLEKTPQEMVLEKQAWLDPCLGTGDWVRSENHVLSQEENISHVQATAFVIAPGSGPLESVREKIGEIFFPYFHNAEWSKLVIVDRMETSNDFLEISVWLIF